MLNPEVQRLSDVDVAVELAPKEADYERAGVLIDDVSQNWPAEAGTSGTSWRWNTGGIGRRSSS
jgi:hypothetical protein